MKQSDTTLNIHTEYLDTKRREYSSDYIKFFSNYIQQKYTGIRPSLIYVTDDNALSFAREVLSQQFENVPVVFSGINNYALLDTLDRQRYTGVYEKKDIAVNLQLLSQLDPQLQNVLIVGDGSNTYRAIERQIRQQLLSYSGISAEYVVEKRIDDLIERIQSHQPRYIFLTTLGRIEDAQGNTLPLKVTISQLVSASDAVILSMEDAYMLPGVLGGYVTSAANQGKAAAEFALAILQGQPVKDLSALSKSPNQYMFDHEMLQHHQITLPDEILNQSHMLNRPESFFNRYRMFFVGSIVSMAILFVLMLIVFVVLMVRKNLQIQSVSARQRELEKLVGERTRALKLETEKLNQAQAITHIGSYAWDLDDDITIWSDELFNIVGQDIKTFKPSYENYVNCIHPDDRECFRQLTVQVKHEKKEYHGEYRILRPNGEIRYIFEQGNVRVDKEGRLTGLVGVIQDISERRQTENTLRSQRDFTDTVVEVAGNVIVVLDLNGCFFRFNHAAEELTGYDRAEVLGKPVWDYVIPEDQREGVKSVFENLRKGNVDIAGHYENDWLLRDGTRRTLSWRNSVLRNNKGEITHIVALGYDISDRRAAEEQKDRLQRELNQARKMEALGQLTGGIAHDFNNMLGIITGYTDLALDLIVESGNPDLQKYLDNISQATQRASTLVKQMMVFSRGGRNVSEVVDLGSILEESMSMLRSVIPSSIHIQIDIEPGLPRVNMDVVQMQQILVNLCLNAKDAMGGEGSLDIHLGWLRNTNRECQACHQQVMGDWLELSVGDNGTGMSADILERIFEPFFTTKEVGQGTGMGLSMVHTIVDNHSGHIYIDTQEGRGTVFRLLFPPLQECDVSERYDDDIRHAGEQRYQGQGEIILLVDDEAALVNFVDEMLRQSGYLCKPFTSSREALEYYKTHVDDVDVLITDQTMPELTGIDLINAIREVREDLPVILATGYSDRVSRRDAEAQGIVYVSKPFTSRDLLSNIAACLRLDKA